MTPLRVRLVLFCLFQLLGSFAEETPGGNRLIHLDTTDPFYVGRDFPKLTTPQWIGEAGVKAVVVLAIDDMRDTGKYESFLRPILERLKKIDGRAPVSIMCNAVTPTNAQLQTWLKEGVSLEVHTLSHPCPLLQKSNFASAAETFHGGVELLHQISGNKPVAFRMPCCDSMNSPSPRFYSEIFSRTNRMGQFLTIDSSVMNVITRGDTSLPREMLFDRTGLERFRKYLPFPSFVTTIDDYPYPYVIAKRGWEFPCVVPSDWEAQNIHGTNNPVTIADWKAALDATLLKQGTFTMIFHPHGWIGSEQLVELIDYAATKYGSEIKFLNFREAQQRLDANLLGGHPLRNPAGQDNGVRLLDLNDDGYIDVVIGTANLKRTRLWRPKKNSWLETTFPTLLSAAFQDGLSFDTGVRFGVMRSQQTIMIVRNETIAGAWQFENSHWREEKNFLRGLELDNRPILTAREERDRGVRFRDLEQDGICELLVGNKSENAVFSWNAQHSEWKKLPYALPNGTSIVDEEGRDNGLRFVDVNEDGYDDIIFSNQEHFSIWLFVAKPLQHLDWSLGWSQKVRAGQAGELGSIPMIVRSGPNRDNGAWFSRGYMWVQNEDTAHLPDKVDRRSFQELVAFPTPPPKSPQESLNSIKVRPGFQVELVAHEPLVQDPIAFDWGADGKLWVVEMGDYPTGVDGRGAPGGRVRFLEDTNHDGRYDSSILFLDRLNFPTGVMPWRNGVLISAAPDVFYVADTNGDGKADFRTVLLTGFGEGNQQHRVNGFEYGLDNWVYGANGDSGGEIRIAGDLHASHQALLQQKPVDLRGRDFRFQPDKGLFELIAGQTQYGRHRDDWGNWFGNNNPNWIWHYAIPEEYLKRNPFLAVKTTKQMLANYPNSSRVFSISRPMQRFNFPGMVNTLTSANSATPYRDELFGEAFATSAFISEPANNLVHREVLTRDGISFTSQRAPDEVDGEFLASSDNWFRPTMLKTGPDGALYIADMYRLVIEHIEYALPGMAKQIDLRAGHDKGRIYRVYPEGAKLRPLQRLDRLDATSLVAALESPNGWQRDTIQRLLVERHDPAAVQPLENVATTSASAKVRLQALCTLDGLNTLSIDLIGSALSDSSSAVREHAVRLSEGFASSGVEAQQSMLVRRLLQLASDPDLRVRYQLAFTLGQWRDARAAEALVKLLQGQPRNAYLETAVLSSALPHLQSMLRLIFAEGSNPSVFAGAIPELVSFATRTTNYSALAGPLQKLYEKNNGQFAPWQLSTLSSFLDALDRQNLTLQMFQSKAPATVRAAVQKIDAIFAYARITAANPGASNRLESIRLVGRGSSQRESDLDILSNLLSPQEPPPIQSTALKALSQTAEPRIAELLLGSWKQQTPRFRETILDTLLGQREWVQSLLQFLEESVIPPNQINAATRQRLLAHRDQSISRRAARVFSSIETDRDKVLADYRMVLDLRGNASRGAAIFQQYCASCHQFKGAGYAIGPDLATLTDKSPQALMVAILNPNASVEAPFVSYAAITKSTREISGVISSETAGSLTLRSPGGSEETVLRQDLKQLTSSGLSLMPEGLEAGLPTEAMADLIAYLRE